MSRELIFYTNPMSRGQIVRWMLEESGAEYQQQIVEYGADMKSEEYLQINPMGKVPAIKHGDTIVTECSAICAYLADSFPDAGLAPATENRGEYYRWLFFAAGPFESGITNNNLGFTTDQEQQRTAGYGTYDLVLSVLDQHLAGRQFVAGDSFSAADIYVGSQVDFGLQFGSIKQTDNFNAYVEGLRSRPKYQLAKQKDMALMPDQ